MELNQLIFPMLNLNSMSPVKKHAKMSVEPINDSICPSEPPPPYNDIHDDFKYAPTPAQSAAEIRLAFIRKVYSILSIQIAITVGVTAVFMTQPFLVDWVTNNSWLVWALLFAAIVILLILIWTRQRFPLNIILLFVFTLIEACTVGVGVTAFQSYVVIKAFFTTFCMFAFLTMFTLQGRFEFEGLGPYLFGGLGVLIFGSTIQAVYPYDSAAQLVFSLIGCLIFMMFIVYDTHKILTRLSPDEYVIGAIELYLDILNLFVYTLDILSGGSRR